MENNNSKQPFRKTDPSNEETGFENPDADPGFDPHQDEAKLFGFEDEREEDIDSNTSIKELREDKENQDEDLENDALNYKNDREHGAYNPKNI